MAGAAPGTTRRRVARVQAVVIDASGMRSRSERLAGEEPLEIRVAVPGGEVVGTTSTMRTPGADFALAAGLLHAEGVVAHRDDLAAIRYCADVQEQRYNVVTVELRRPPRRALAPRTIGSTASCGVCGTATIDELAAWVAPVGRGGGGPEPGDGPAGGSVALGDGPVDDAAGSGSAGPGDDAVGSGSAGPGDGAVGPGSAGPGDGAVGSGSAGPGDGAVGPGPAATGRAVFDPTVLALLPDRLRAAQPVFDETGGLHAAGLFSATGEVLAVHEDVGRHNALDKVLGERFLAGGLPASDAVVVLSGRVSFELVQKAAVAGVPVICAVSAPSSLAVETADRLGVTLAAFVRDGRMTVYAHPERIIGA